MKRNVFVGRRGFALGALGRAMALVCGSLGFVAGVHAAPATVVPYLKVDQFGYLTTMRKVAVVADPQVGFNAAQSFNPGDGINQYQVRRWVDDVPVFTGSLTPWAEGTVHAQSGDRGWHFDFSSVTMPGSYYIWDTVRQVGSGRFEIGPRVYDEVLRQAQRMFFYQRLNQAKQQPFAEASWTDAAAYERPGQDRSATSRFAKGQTSTARDLSGGWADAGDTSKYVTFSQNAVLQLLDAYRFNPGIFRDDIGIPESGNGVPDLLDEVKWQLDFLKRMQDATGTQGLLLKVGSDNYQDVSPPSADARPRYYLPECTSATFAGAAMFSSAAVVYRGLPSQASYAADLLRRAEAAWARGYAASDAFQKLQTACDDGDIKAGRADVSVQGQLDSALVAAVALYEATGKSEYKQRAEFLYGLSSPMKTRWWGPHWAPIQRALLRYAGLPGVSSHVAAEIRDLKSRQFGLLSLTDFITARDLYRAHMEDEQYTWGHNGIRANAGLINLDFAAFNISPSRNDVFLQVGAAHLHWLHGVNPHSLVMLTAMERFGAESSASEIYHSWFANGTVWDSSKTSLRGPAPGFLTGGPNRDYSGAIDDIRSQPPQKAFRDWNTGWPESAWEVTQPGIYHQAAYIELLARVLVGRDDQRPSPPMGLKFRGATGSSISVSWDPAQDNVGVVAYDIWNHGRTWIEGLTTPAGALLGGLKCGSAYVLTVRARDAAGNVSTPSNMVVARTANCPTTN